MVLELFGAPQTPPNGFRVSPAKSLDKYFREFYFMKLQYSRELESYSKVKTHCECHKEGVRWGWRHRKAQITKGQSKHLELFVLRAMGIL